MSNEINRGLITDSQDLDYISIVVNKVLDNKHYSADIKDVQKTLKEISLEHGRELQMNLAFEENKLVGFNFSFTNDPNKKTLTIPFRQEQLNAESVKGDIIPYKQTTTIAARQSKGNLTTFPENRGEIILTPGLQVEGQHIINPDENETQGILKSPSSGITNINSDLTNVANQLTNQHEVNGLLLTGLTLKTGITLAKTGATEEKPDIHTAGLAIIKRFQQVLPQEFIELKAGETPKAFNWTDPQSNKQYQFCFEVSQTDTIGNILVPTSLKGYEKISGSDSMQPVFSATLIDDKYNRWSIEQCDFNKSQIKSLNLATKPTPPNDSTVLTNTVGDFSYYM